MTKPFVSVVIPTLNRADTLEHTLATLTAQDYPDCEFVVQNNGHDAKTEAVVRAVGDSRLRHFSSEAVLPMCDNWEAGLANSRGELVTFVGDDDGLLPDACRIGASLVQQHDVELISWAPFWFFWPSYFEAGLRDRLLATVDGDFSALEVSSREELARVYGYRSTYDRLPMIYNSFVRRRVIERARQRLGRYFVGISPDLTSGIINAAVTDTFVRLSRPLSVTGTSKHSTGHLLSYSDDQEQRAEALARDFHPFASDPRLPDINILPTLLARDLLVYGDLLFRDDSSIALDYRGLAVALATSINDYPGAYDSIVGAIGFLGRAHGFDTGDIIVPPLAISRSSAVPGVKSTGDGRLSFVLAGDALGLRTVAEAVRLVAQLVPRAEALEGPPVPEHADERLGTMAHLSKQLEASDARAAALQRACDERLGTMAHLSKQLEASHARAAALQRSCDERLEVIERMEADLRASRDRADQLQRHCDERLALIERLSR